MFYEEGIIVFYTFLFLQQDLKNEGSNISLFALINIGPGHNPSTHSAGDGHTALGCNYSMLI